MIENRENDSLETVSTDGSSADGTGLPDRNPTERTRTLDASTESMESQSNQATSQRDVFPDWYSKRQQGSAVGIISRSANGLLGVPVLVAITTLLLVVAISTRTLTTAEAILINIFVGGLFVFVGGIAATAVGSTVRGGSFELLAASYEVLGRIVALVSVLVFWLLAVLVGLLLFVVPGLYVGMRMILAFPACVVDERSPVDSIAISWIASSGAEAKIATIALLCLAPPLYILASIQIATELTIGATTMILLTPVLGAVAITFQMAITHVYFDHWEPQFASR